MTPLSRSVRWALLLRSFAVQGSWNYQTLIGTGFAFVLLPALRRIYRDDPAELRLAIARHAELFNSHPYLATLAAGATARLEAERAPPEMVQRFKTALRGSLGSIGDQLVWLAWRPVTALLSIVLLLMGAAWWAAVGVFLLVHNALHLWLRVWGLRIGLENGFGVAKMLREAPFQGWGRRALDVGAFLAGLAVTLAIASAGNEPIELSIAFAAALLGLWLGLRVRGVIWAVLTAVWAVGLILGAFHRLDF